MSSLRGSYRTWFSTPRGREVVFYVIGTAAIGTGIGNALPHTFLLHKYQEFVQMYKFGAPVPVPKTITLLMENVMNDMNISERERKFIKAFTVFAFDVFHAGTTFTKQGALIGIPSSFSYSSTEDVDKSHIIVNLKPVNWNSNNGKTLQEALVLSDAAKKFAIGREISSTRSAQVLLNSIFPACVITFVYGFSKHANDRLGLLNKHISVRLVFYSLISLFGFGTWAFLKDYTTVHYEIQADKEICKLGEDYVKGGSEFYSKLLLRNKALRELMGEQGAKMYTVTGNERYMIRQKHLPLTLRKEYIETRLKDLERSSSASIPAPA